MSVMTIVIANISDVAGFAEAGNSWGKQKLMDMGCLDVTASRVVHGGELAGVATIAFEWESADASIAGSDAINADSQMLQMMGDTGVSIVRRTLFGVMGERGERSGPAVSVRMFGASEAGRLLVLLGNGPRDQIAGRPLAPAEAGVHRRLADAACMCVGRVFSGSAVLVRMLEAREAGRVLRLLRLQVRQQTRL